MGLGADVAVVHLAEEVTDVSPIAIGTLSHDDVGRRFLAIGYGGQSTYLFDPATGEFEEHDDDSAFFGTRRAGSLTLHGIDGRYWEHWFGSFEAFLDHMRKVDDPEDIAQPDWEARKREEYDAFTLRDHYDAFFGEDGPSEAGDVHVCGGDSGGPILAVVDGTLTTYGVVSGHVEQPVRPEFAEPRYDCLAPAVYSTYGQEALHLVEAAAACGGVTQQGGCEGDTAVRCTRSEEGPARVVRSDCGSLGLSCAATPTEPVCAPACASDDDCNALAEGGACGAGGVCSWEYSCAQEEYPFACLLCCALPGGDFLECFQECFADGFPAGPTISVGGLGQ
jgi:hypothetical protein